MSVVPFERFSYNKERKELVAEISELRALPIHSINVQSPLTGRIITFNLVNTTRDVDGDISFWTLVPKPGSVRTDLTMIVYND